MSRARRFLCAVASTSCVAYFTPAAAAGEPPPAVQSAPPTALPGGQMPTSWLQRPHNGTNGDILFHCLHAQMVRKVLGEEANAVEIKAPTPQEPRLHVALSPKSGQLSAHAAVGLRAVLSTCALRILPDFEPDVSWMAKQLNLLFRIDFVAANGARREVVYSQDGQNLVPRAATDNERAR